MTATDPNICTDSCLNDTSCAFVSQQFDNSDGTCKLYPSAGSVGESLIPLTGGTVYKKKQNG
jgi:hypothetical protein